MTKKRKSPYESKKEKQERIAIMLQFTNPEEIKLIKELKHRIVQGGKQISTVIKSFLIEIIKKEGFQKSFAEVRNDVFYSFRKAAYISQIPFYLKVEEFRLENELILDVLNKKINLLVNLVYEFTRKDIAKFSPADTENFYYFQKLEDDIANKLATIKSRNLRRKQEMQAFYNNFRDHDENAQTENDFLGEE